MMVKANIAINYPMSKRRIDTLEWQYPKSKQTILCPATHQNLLLETSPSPNKDIDKDTYYR